MLVLFNKPINNYISIIVSEAIISNTIVTKKFEYTELNNVDLNRISIYSLSHVNWQMWIVLMVML